VLTARYEKRPIELWIGRNDYMHQYRRFWVSLKPLPSIYFGRSQGQAQNIIEYGNVCLDLEACTSNGEM